MNAVIDAGWHPLAGGVPPLWASAWGQDRYGVWLAFTMDGVVQRLRWIKPGRFLMGSPADEAGRWADEGPRHEVILTDGFWLFDTPCTQALWQCVMGENPSRFKGEQRPVEQVSWDDCQDFLQRLNHRIPGLVLTLPSEAQWEYACRAGTNESRYGALADVAWYDDNAAGGTQPVAQKPINPWGLYDLLGNVDEWCLDGERDYRPETAVNPVGQADTGGQRVVRGGAWVSPARHVRAAYRAWYGPGARNNFLGLRPALVQVNR